MIDEEKSCCMCGTTKFIGRVNTGKKYYCNACMRKIRDSGIDYFKPCSQVEFFESMLSNMKKDKDDGPPNMFKNIRKTLKKIKDNEKNNFKS